MRTVIAGILLVAMCTLTGQAMALTADEMVSRIQKAYEGVEDLTGTFSQTNHIRDLNKKETYKGTFWIKRPLKMKWSYRGGAAQDLTINQDTVLILKKGDKTAYRARFSSSSFGQTPVALLSGMGDIRKEFTASVKDGKLLLLPKNPMGNVSSVLIALSDDPFPIQSFVVQDGRSNVIEILLRDVEINTGIRDSVFSVSVPKGVTVLDQTP